MKKIKDKIGKKCLKAVEYIQEYHNKLDGTYKKDIEDILNLNMGNFTQYIGNISTKENPLGIRVENSAYITRLKTRRKARANYTVTPVRLACLLIKIDLTKYDLNNKIRSRKAYIMGKLTKSIEEIKKNVAEVNKNDGINIQLTQDLLDIINEEGF